MGSSPLTATPLQQALLDLFQPLLRRGNRRKPAVVLAAFSGGPDSTALLAGLAAVLPALGGSVVAAHFDHALDGDSARRAAAAGRLAATLGVPWVHERRTAPLRGGGQEAAARTARYAFLERQARRLGAPYVATAHHADDQAETVLLRLLQGSGLDGLAGIAPRRPLGDAVLVRPLLGLRRRELAASLVGMGWVGTVPVEDPTNADPAIARNRLRHHVMPALAGDGEELVEGLANLAGRAASVRRRIGTVLEAQLAPVPVPEEDGVRVRREAFAALPDALLPQALAWLHRLAGVPYPASAAARRDLLRQLAGRPGDRVGCDCGGGWRWEASSGWLQLVRNKPERVDFTYTLETPGEVAMPEIGIVVRLRRGKVAPWMFTHCPKRAGLACIQPACFQSTCIQSTCIQSTQGDGEGHHVVEVRNRRPGDRLIPFGSRGRRRLKDLLIDRQVPQRQRDRLPLLVIDGVIAWVPGVTIDERFRLERSDTEAWIAEILDFRNQSLQPAGTSGDE